MKKVTEDVLWRIDVWAMGERTKEDQPINPRFQTDIHELIWMAQSNAFQNGYWDIYSCRPILGSIIVFTKKAIRKLMKVFLGWYLFPIYNRQSEFNRMALEIIERQNKSISLLEGHIEVLESRLCNMEESE